MPNEAAGQVTGKHPPKRSQSVIVAADGLPVDAWMLTAAGFLALGLPIAEISRRLHRARESVRAVRDTRPDLVLQAVSRLTNPADVFGPMLPTAAGAYQRALARGDTTAARDVFDRLYGKPLQRQQRVERRDVRITFIDGPD